MPRKPGLSLTASEKISDMSKFETAVEKLFLVLGSSLNSALENQNRTAIHIFAFSLKKSFLQGF